MNAPTTFPTREQALDLADGWIAHNGGECPLAYDTMIQVRFGDGLEDTRPHCAGFWSNWWFIRDRSRRIAAYRPVNLPRRLDELAARRKAR